MVYILGRSTVKFCFLLFLLLYLYNLHSKICVTYIFNTLLGSLRTIDADNRCNNTIFSLSDIPREQDNKSYTSNVPSLPSFLYPTHIIPAHLGKRPFISYHPHHISHCRLRNKRRALDINLQCTEQLFVFFVALWWFTHRQQLKAAFVPFEEIKKMKWKVHLNAVRRCEWMNDEPSFYLLTTTRQEDEVHHRHQDKYREQFKL